MTSGDDEVQVLVEELSAQLGRSVLVDDASLRLVAYSPTYGTEDEVRRTAILTRETPRVIRDIHFSQGIATASRPLRTAAKPELGLQSRVCVPIRCQGTLFGYLWLIDADDSLTHEDRDHAERCAADIGAAMYRRQELEKPRRELEQRRVEALLEGAASEREEAAHELHAGDMLLPGTGVAAVVVRARVGADEELSSAQKARLSLALDQFRRALPIRHALSLVRSDHGIVLLASDPAMRRAGGLPELAHRLHDSLERTPAVDTGGGSRSASATSASISRTPIAPTRTPGSPHESRAAYPSTRRWRDGMRSARTACWPSWPPEPRPRSSSTRACRGSSSCSPRSRWSRRSRRTWTTGATRS